MNRIAESWSEVDQRRADVMLSLGFSVWLTVAVFAHGDLEGSVVLNVLAGLVLTSSLLLRRRRPLLTAIIASAAGLATTAFLTPLPEVTPAVIALIVVSYSVATHAALSRALLGLVAVAGSILVISIVETPGDVLWPFFIFGIAPWVLGRALRGHTRLARELAEQETRARHLREQEEASAVAQERTRVARELHDVVAHNLSVMVIQASGAQRALPSDPASAIAAAELIERTGREALSEIRHVFGPLRRGEGESLEGSVGLVQAETLVARAQQAGLDASLRIEGDPVALAPGAEAAGYRLIQEGLTNALKHAGIGATAEVVLSFRPRGVSIVVSDGGDGYRSGKPPAGGGLGLIGMRERIELYDGEFEAGPRERAGFEIRAQLPIEQVRVAV